jgi:hypothetical protein
VGDTLNLANAELFSFTEDLFTYEYDALACKLFVSVHKNNNVARRGFGLVVRAAGWHTSDPGSILGRDGLYTFGCIPPAL